MEFKSSNNKLFSFFSLYNCFCTNNWSKYHLTSNSLQYTPKYYPVLDEFAYLGEESLHADHVVDVPLHHNVLKALKKLKRLKNELVDDRMTANMIVA